MIETGEFEVGSLGRTGRRVARLALGSSYGIGAAGVERAYHEHGVNYLYWGSVPRPSFGRGIRNLAKQHREDLVVVLQTYVRVAKLMKASIRLGLRRLGLEYADVMLLGWFNHMPGKRFIDAALAMKEAGMVRHIAISGHNRQVFPQFAASGVFDVLHVRYNAAHRGAEVEVFDHLGGDPPGVVSFTTTRWGSLLDPKRTPSDLPTPSATDCYRFSLSHRNVDAVMAGPKNDAELTTALAALSAGPMDDEELAWMRKVGDHVHG